MGMRASTLSFKDFLESIFEKEQLINDDVTLEEARGYVVQYEVAVKTRSPWGLRLMFAVIIMIFCGCSFIILVYAMKMEMNGSLSTDFLFDALMSEAQDMLINNPLEILITTYLAVGVIAKFKTLRNNKILNALFPSERIKKAKITDKKRRESMRSSITGAKGLNIDPAMFTESPLSGDMEAGSEVDAPSQSSATSAVTVEMTHITSWSSIGGLRAARFDHPDEASIVIVPKKVGKGKKRSIVDIVPGALQHIQRTQDGIDMRPPTTERRASVAIIKPLDNSPSSALPRSDSPPTFLRRSSLMSNAVNTPASGYSPSSQNRPLNLHESSW
jgi:hypothetical protein